MKINTSVMAICVVCVFSFLLGFLACHFYIADKTEKAIEELRVKQPVMFVLYADHDFDTSIFINCIKEQSRKEVHSNNTAMCLSKSAFRR